MTLFWMVRWALSLPIAAPPLPLIHFVLDVHLGRLAAYLRMLGFDALYSSDLGRAVLGARESDFDLVDLSRRLHSCSHWFFSFNF